MLMLAAIWSVEFCTITASIVVQLIFNTHAFMFCSSRVNIGGKSKFLAEEQTWMITVHLELQDGPYSLTLIPGMLTTKAALTNS